jgi:hypothetical protein
MNRFRTKKKAKEPTEGLVRGSIDSDAPAAPTIKPSKTFRRGKKSQEPEPKLELDLSTALPSSDDFRTSLLMSGLSARFSMLREQDDPKSKIGKASDDSVLFPKRQSRLNDLGFASHGLSDIAEVSSINGSIRRPFAFDRTDSYHEGYGTDDDSTHGSIMNRAKPGEGNNLFGGRQKIYKIPVNATTKSLTEGGGGGMGGRALYENDVSQSAFQKLREREREQQRLEQERERDEEQQNAQSSRAESPPLSGYNRNRETSSTTSSGGPSITRSSTAATSFTSQRTPSLSGSHTPATSGAPISGASGLDRTMTKGRRLYETGLDQHLHEQQYSAMNRIDTLTKQRTRGAQTPPPGLSSPIGTNPAERWDRQQIPGKSSLPNMRAASPPPNVSALGIFEFGQRPTKFAETKPSFGLASPPLSPPMSENDDHTVLAVQPNDRGKATALGAFSKPAQPYDENKYSQRQLQMQQGRETPPLRKHSPPRAFAPRQQQQQMGRSSADSSATFESGRSRSNSSAQRQFLPQDRIPEVSSPKSQDAVPENEAVESGTFLNSPNGSSLGSPDDVEQVTKPQQPFIFPSQIYRQNQQQTHERPPESQHPANRQQQFQLNSSSPMKGRQSPSIPGSDSFSRTDDLSATPADTPPADSPTLGPTTGLSGMVRQHLRSDSNTSSVYGGGIPPSAGLTSRFPYDPTEPLPQNEYTTKNNPWNNDDWDQASYEENKFSLDNAVDETRGHSAIPPPLSIRSPNVDGAVQEPSKSSWEKELETHHTRDGSSETQKERLDFKAELATRRRRVQEHLKSFHETESRSASPAPTSDWSRDGPVKIPALGLLKTKSSRGSLVGKTREAGQSKAMKMLGIGNATIYSSPSPSKSQFDENAWKEEEEEMLRGVPKGPTIPPQTKAFRQARRDAQRDRERQVALRHQQKVEAGSYGNGNDAEWVKQPTEGQHQQKAAFRDRVPPNIRTGRRTPSRERGPPPVTQSHRNGSSQESKGSIGTNKSNSRPPSRTSRDRSSSDASGRSKSRNGRYRDDLAKAMAEGIGSSSQGAFDEMDHPSARLNPKSPATPALAMQPSPSPMIGSNPVTRNRSNSKSTPANYFDSQKLQPLQTGEGMDIGLSPRPSPITPYSVNSTPSLPQPSPAGSGANTPTLVQGFPAQGRTPGARKISINKSDISEPRLLSSTSRVPTVELPPGASLQNGMEAPPIPPVNPRRRQARAIFGFGKKDEHDEYSLPVATHSTEEMSTFSADEGESKVKIRQKLRKSSSEGGNLNARVRQAAVASPSPALPSGFQGNGSPPRPYEGGMF